MVVLVNENGLSATGQCTDTNKPNNDTPDHIGILHSLVCNMSRKIVKPPKMKNSQAKKIYLFF